MLCPHCVDGVACHVCGGTQFLPAGFVKNAEPDAVEAEPAAPPKKSKGKKAEPAPVAPESTE